MSPIRKDLFQQSYGSCKAICDEKSDAKVNCITLVEAVIFKQFVFKSTVVL